MDSTPSSSQVSMECPSSALLGQRGAPAAPQPSGPSFRLEAPLLFTQISVFLKSFQTFRGTRSSKAFMLRFPGRIKEKQ